MLMVMCGISTKLTMVKTKIRILRGSFMTNFKRIKEMNKYQLAKFLANLNGGGTVRYEQFLKWLGEKVDD